MVTHMYLKPSGMVYNSRNLIIRLVFMSMGIHMNYNLRCMVYNFSFVENSIDFDVYGYLNALEICFLGLQFNKLWNFVEFDLNGYSYALETPF